MRIATGATCQLIVSWVSSAILPDMASHRKSYSADFKRQLQVLASLRLNNENISQTARQHGVTPPMSAARERRHIRRRGNQ